MSMAKDLGFILPSCQNREHSANSSSVSTSAMLSFIPLFSNNKPMATWPPTTRRPLRGALNKALVLSLA